MKRTIEKKLVKKRAIPGRKLAKKRLAPKKAEVKTKVGGITAGAHKKQVREKSQSVDTMAFAREGLGARSGQQSGDLQGLSNVQGADSESVDELLEEGNAFEAEVVKGVEEAGDADAAEVRTHEVPQDDVDIPPSPPVLTWKQRVARRGEKFIPLKLSPEEQREKREASIWHARQGMYFAKRALESANTKKQRERALKGIRTYKEILDRNKEN
jgi:hypothetical protein